MGDEKATASKQAGSGAHLEYTVTYRDIFPDGWHVSSEEVALEDGDTLVTMTFHTEGITTNVNVFAEEAEVLAEALFRHARGQCEHCVEDAKKAA